MAAEEDRHYPNPYPDPLVASEVKINEMRAIIGPKLNSLYSQLMLEAGTDPHSKDYTVYTGTGGLALVALTIGLTLSAPQRDAYVHRAKAILLAAQERILKDRTRRGDDREDVTFVLGPPGIFSQLAVLHSLEGDVGAAEQAAREVLRYKGRVLSGAFPFEVLYGAAGYLHALLFIKSYVPELIPHDAVTEVVDYILTKAERGPNGSILPTWHGKPYLGAAHGVTGIITNILDAARFITLRESQVKQVHDSIEYVRSLALPSGNYPTRPTSSSDTLVQWCHGAPGPLLLFVRAFETFRDPKYLAWAEEASDVVWERGLLKKGVGLCHGISGNACCFLCLYRATGNDMFLQRALQFAVAADELPILSSSRPDHPWSLYEGLGGLALLYFFLLNKDQRGHIPTVAIV